MKALWKVINKQARPSSRQRFDRICQSVGLQLDYTANKAGLSVLEDIFVRREYSDYFPFYDSVTIVDIGAHYGYFSLFAALNTAENARIIAVEPSSSNYQVLQANRTQNQIHKVTALQLAVGEADTTGQLHEGDSVNHSLIANYDLLRAGGSSHSVQVASLETLMRDQNLTTIDFLKVDCEGAEYGIFLNTSDHVLNRIQVISMEFHDRKDGRFTANKLVDRFRDCGFSIPVFHYCPSNKNLNYGRLVAVRR